MHGYKGCPLCGPETCAEHARLLHKMVYLGARRFLDAEHTFRRARAAFNNHPESEIAPERPTGEEILQWAMEREAFLRGGGVKNSSDDPVKRHGVKRRSIFYLPYWQVLFYIFYVNSIFLYCGIVGREELRSAWGEMPCSH